MNGESTGKNEPELFFNWTTPTSQMNPDEQIEALIEHEDSTPSLLDQAKKNKWECAYYDFGKGENRGYEWFNPSIVERPDGLWLLARGSEPHPQGFRFGQNNVWAFMLDDTGTIPKMGKKLTWLVKDGNQHFEDPRGFYHAGMNQTMIGACSFCWYPNQPWTGAHQVFGMFDDRWECQRMFYPKVGGNPGKMEKITKHENYEKNWTWFLCKDKLHLLYKARPWMVVEFGNTWDDRHDWKDEGGAVWAWGDIRGGTPPVQVGNYFFTFPHSSLPWKSRYRRYYAGCIAFEAKPPFRPKLITKEPLLIGSQNDVWAQKKPLVVFPCGALFKDNEWFITMGVNDMKAAWIRIPHNDILSRLTPIGEAEVIFMGSGLSDGEREAQHQRRSRSAKLGHAKAEVERQQLCDALEVPTEDKLTDEQREILRQEMEKSVEPRKRPMRKVKRRRRKFSPEALKNLRLNAANARAARQKMLAQKNV